MLQAVTSSRKWSIQPASSQEIDSSPVRYGLTALLPKIRFLLPLCSQRWRLVHELLHTTELSAPDYMPVIMVDRRVPLVERHADSRSSVFLQVYRELRGEKLHFRLACIFLAVLFVAATIEVAIYITKLLANDQLLCCVWNYILCPFCRH